MGALCLDEYTGARFALSSRDWRCTKDVKEKGVYYIDAQMSATGGEDVREKGLRPERRIYDVNFNLIKA